MDLGILYRHDEADVVDFDKERLLPHKLSQYGPGIAVGDIDGNGLDDLVIGGNTILEPAFLLQQKGGNLCGEICQLRKARMSGVLRIWGYCYLMRIMMAMMICT
jgi:hypothetical protein